MKMLFLDQNIAMRSSVTTALRSKYDVSTLQIDVPSDVADAINKVKTNIYDLIISEYYPSGNLSGYDFLERMRLQKLASWKTAFIILTSQEPATKDLEKVLWAGELNIDAYIYKPFTPAYLIGKILLVLNKKMKLNLIYDLMYRENFHDAITHCKVYRKRINQKNLSPEDKELLSDIIYLELICYIKQEDYSAIINLYEESLKSKNTLIHQKWWFQYFYAKSLFKLWNYSKAEEVSVRLKQEFPRYVKNYELLSDICHITHQDEKAIELLKKAVEFSPLNMERQLLLWKKALLQWDLELAQKTHETVIEKGSNSCLYGIDTHTNLAHIYGELWQFDEALVVLSEGVKALKESDPSGVEFATSVMESQIFAKKWDTEKSKESFNKALQIYEEHLESSEKKPINISDDMKIFFSAECLENGKEEVAKELITEVIEKTSHRQDELQKHWKKIVRNPGNLAKVDEVIQETKAENALSMYEQILSQDQKEDPMTQKFQNAMKMIDSWELQEASLLLEEIVDGVYDPQKSYYQNAFEIAKNGDWKKSLSLLKLESIRNPQNPRSYFDLAQITIFYINNFIESLLQDLVAFEKLYSEARTYFETAKVLAWSECDTTYSSNIRQFTMVNQRVLSKKNNFLS